MSLPINYSNVLYECGTDEAGRGCLAGPVTAAAVILPLNFKNTEITDSKLLSKKKRLHLNSVIEDQAIAYAYAHVWPKTIDKLNILNASILAMHKAIALLKTSPEFISVDGNRFHPYKDTPYSTIIKGDAKYLNIAAASIIAKTARDACLDTIHEEFPMYQWNTNKGYPTKAHKAAIKTYGITEYHRKSFKLNDTQIKLEFP